MILQLATVCKQGAGGQHTHTHFFNPKVIAPIESVEGGGLILKLDKPKFSNLKG